MTSGRELISRLIEAKQYFGDTKYWLIVNDAEEAWALGLDTKVLESILNQLPTDETLLTELVEKLKGKSVHKALERAEGKSDWAALKAVSSLLTHTVISCQQGETQYKKLIPKMLERINELSYKLIK